MKKFLIGLALICGIGSAGLLSAQGAPRPPRSEYGYAHQGERRPYDRGFDGRRGPREHFDHRYDRHDRRHKDWKKHRHCRHDPRDRHRHRG